jgi:ATP-dependent helicase/nuclease subunit A
MGVGFKVTLKNENGKYATHHPAMLRMIRAKKKRDEQEEANRILYVAMTRARDRLYVTSAGKEARDFASLVPGLEAAKIEIHRHDGAYQPEHAPSILLESKKPPYLIEQLSPVAPHFDAVAVTGLVDYSICPRRFKFKYVDGHPGVGEGVSANARLVGTLTHTALELGIYAADELRPFADGASEALIQQAVDLALAFRDGESFRSFQLGEFKREVSIRHDLNGTILAGKADLVGNEFVLDFKTDSLDKPADHAVQLWIYAKALKKPKAYVAYLRQQKLHEYTAEDFAEAATIAAAAIEGIATAKFNSTPSEHACTRCPYCVICDERHKN